MLDQTQIQVLRKNIEKAQENLDQAKKILEHLEVQDIALSTTKLEFLNKGQEVEVGEMIEGVFDGQNMLGPDGKAYSVPENYASKSKLVEGDILKLFIYPEGRFLYKQIKPIERERMRGIIVKDKETQNYGVLAEDQFYSILTASVTYYKARPGDEAIILVPCGGKSKWAALDNLSSGLDTDPDFHI